MRTLVINTALVLCSSVLSAQQDLCGLYRTGWGTELVLEKSGSFEYKSFECYQLLKASGTWTVRGDTLSLNSDPVPTCYDLTEVRYRNHQGQGIRVSVSSTAQSKATFEVVELFTSNDTLFGVTDTVGLVDFNVERADSVRVSGFTTVVLDTEQSEKRHIEIVFRVVNDHSSERFDCRPFIVRGRKLHYVYGGRVSNKKYFKQERNNLFLIPEKSKSIE